MNTPRDITGLDLMRLASSEMHCYWELCNEGQHAMAARWRHASMATELIDEAIEVIENREAELTLALMEQQP